MMKVQIQKLSIFKVIKKVSTIQCKANTEVASFISAKFGLKVWVNYTIE